MAERKIPTDEVCDAVEMNFPPGQFAYVATQSNGDWRLSVVVQGDSGHYPLRDFAQGTRDEMQALADRLNRDRLELTPDAATRLVLQSLRPRTNQAGQPIENVTFIVVCLDDEGMIPKWTLATRQVFPSLAAAEKYRDSIANSREAIVVSGEWGALYGALATPI